MANDKRFLLIVKLKGGKGHGSTIYFRSDYIERVWDKISDCQRQFKDLYKGYVLYNKIEEA